MIFDRTQQDVDEAKAIFAEKIQNFIPLTEAEKNTIEKGLFGIDTLNRIESKQAELTATLNSMGYYSVGTHTQPWERGELFKKEDLARICHNSKNLKTTILMDSEKIEPRLHYEQINLIERFCAEVEEKIMDIKSLYRYCGDAVCVGGE